MIVLAPAALIAQDAIGLGELGGPVGRHRLKLLAEMLDLVGVILRDLRAECLLDFIRRRVRSDLEELVIVLQNHLFLELRDVGGRRQFAPAFGGGLSIA